MKYRNKPTGVYASKKECRRASELQLLAKIGAISDLKEQVKYEVIPSQPGERAAHYIADFVYVENGQTVVEDAKGMKTPAYILKRKLMLFRHGIRVKEV